MPRHIHIDVHGGLSGDMFIATMLDAFPSLLNQVIEDLKQAGLTEHVTLKTAPSMANGIRANSIEFVNNSHNPRPTHHYSHIKKRLESSSLSQTILKRTIKIFDLLAAAEASVHGVNIEDVHFHEVADWDSQADIVAAASLIERCHTDTWSCGNLPIGGGTVSTEHGTLPVPAPATTHLLSEFTLHDDGELGERITPTGAAILKHLISDQHTNKRPKAVLRNTGTGCGTKRFKTVPNIARVLVFDLNDVQLDSASKSFIGGADSQLGAQDASQAASQAISKDTVCMIDFDIDDMTPEELAIACENLRQTTGVLNVQHTLAIGKKGRATFSIQLMCEPMYEMQVSIECFEQTSTIGLRCMQTQRYLLKREQSSVSINGRSVPVKTTQRPNGAQTTKVESDALNTKSTLKERRRLAMQCESTKDYSSNNEHE